MEGPSLFLAKQQLRPFKGMTIVSACGNSKTVNAADLEGETVRDVFAWGKHLVFQFESFALRFHFLMFGSFEAECEGVWVTGDYRRTREPRLELRFRNGQFKAYSCSIRRLETRHAKADYDFRIDIMSPRWEEAHVRKLLRAQKDAQIADALLDQDIFAGVGNIIKNEVLALAHIRPTRKVRTLAPTKLREIVATTRQFSRQFYLWCKAFQLRTNLRTHRKTRCRFCGGPLVRRKTGARERWSYWCPKDQK